MTNQFESTYITITYKCLQNKYNESIHLTLKRPKLPSVTITL